MAMVNSRLDDLRIATPCPISWEQMTGDDRVRFCDHCQLNVYNIAELTRTEAESLIASTEGRLCGRLYRRADGSVLTKDCPVGLRALRKRVSQRVAAMFAAMLSFSATVLGQQPAASDTRSCPAQTKITRAVNPADSQSVVSGTVYDPNGAVITAATITLTKSDTKTTSSTVVNEAGHFEFVGVLPGDYEVAIEIKTPFLSQKFNLSVESGQLVTVDTYAQVAQVSNAVFVGLIDGGYKSIDRRVPNTNVINEDMIKRLPIQWPW